MPVRARIDWQAAESFYLGLDPPRSFGDVARHFGVSDTRVSQIARREHWRDKAADVDRAVHERSLRAAVQSREQRRNQALRIVDRYMGRYAAELDKHDLKPADLPGIVKLAELLEGEATDRIAVGEVQVMIQGLLGYVGEFVPGERRAEFLAGLPAVMGQLPGSDGT